MARGNDVQLGGITDLNLLADIRPGFVDALEVITYADRLRKVLRTLNGLRLGAPSLGPQGSVTVSLDLRNSGPCDGDEVVQLYVRHPESRIPRPLQALKAFTRVTVPAGGRRTVELTLKAADLAHWDAARQAWSVETGPVDLWLGASSRDIRLRGRLELTA